MSTNALNSLVTDIAELILQRTNIDEVQQQELWSKLYVILNLFFGYPEHD